MIDSVKMAENAVNVADGVVVRLYESMGGRGQVTLTRLVIQTV